MTDWRFFDAHCRIGLHQKVGEPPFNPHTAEELLADMDRAGIHEAIVIDCLSQENSPSDGNPRIIETVKDHPRLHAGWVAVPPGTDEMPGPAEMIAQMREHKIGLLYMFPNQYRFPMTDWAVDDLLGPMADARVPLYVSYEEIGATPSGADITNWPELVELCRRHPALPVIVGEMRIRRTMRTVYRAMQACENLHLDLSAYWLHRGVEYLSERFGSHRLLFGSNWPTMNHGATSVTIACADINDDAKANIAGDNLRRLISWCDIEHPTVTLPPAADELAAWGHTGEKPQGTTLYDNHGHLGGSSGHYHVPEGDTDSMVRDMDRFGIQTCCVFSIQGVFSDERYGNDLIIDAVQRHPDRFIGFTLVNPHRGPDAMRQELQRCLEAGLRGIKLIPTYQRYPEEGPNIDVACQFAHEHQQFILNHQWGSAAQMERLVRTYTNACFFTGHTTTAYKDIMKKYDNLYVCTCPVHGPCAVEKHVAAFGADRFLFGSDLTDLPIAWGVGPVLVADISEAEKRLIIGENLKHLMETYSLPRSTTVA